MSETHPLTLDEARDAVVAVCVRRQVHLLYPGVPGFELVRGAHMLALNAASGPRVFDAATRARLEHDASFTVAPVPMLGLVEQIPVVGPALASSVRAIGADRITVCPSPAAWGDAVRLIGDAAHELGHVYAVQYAQRTGGDLGAALWCIANLWNPLVRVSEEACNLTANVGAQVILAGERPSTAAAAALAALDADGAYLAHAGETLRSCIASLDAGALHGEGTPLVELLCELEARGVDLGAWLGAVRRNGPALRAIG